MRSCQRCWRCFHAKETFSNCNESQGSCHIFEVVSNFLFLKYILILSTSLICPWSACLLSCGDLCSREKEIPLMASAHILSPCQNIFQLSGCFWRPAVCSSWFFLKINFNMFLPQFFWWLLLFLWQDMFLRNPVLVARTNETMQWSGATKRWWQKLVVRRSHIVWFTCIWAIERKNRVLVLSF